MTTRCKGCKYFEQFYNTAYDRCGKPVFIESLQGECVINKNHANAILVCRCDQSGCNRFDGNKEETGGWIQKAKKR